ncbi:MAG: YdeI/OmpD-associated family protein [Variovorax sp.]|nr:YdeI/OmpD-associated family protein [Variovorax sp.]
MKGDLPVIAFASAEDWATWLTHAAGTSRGLWLKLAKKRGEVRSVSRKEAVEVALCHGWIDGQLDKYDDHWWLVRFTPRSPKSKWSEDNRTTALRLIEDGRMLGAGLEQVQAARADGRWDAAYASQSTAAVPADLAAALEAAPAAKRFFEKLNRANRFAILYRVHDAKTQKTRLQRIQRFVVMLERGELIHPPKKTIKK